MSKSNSSSRSSSVEMPADCDNDKEGSGNRPQVPPILESAGGELEVVPSSPPPSYEHVLEEEPMSGEETQNCNTKIDTTRQKAKSDASTPTNSVRGPEIMHKSSKELYRAVAKQFGITCKMSDQCRCFDCQSHYFDCEYEQNEQEKTDGGLGAGTPMFISVMNSGTCTIL